MEDSVGAEELKTIYRHRFDEREIVKKRAVWQILCSTYFSRYITSTDTVLDIGAGYCEFINYIGAARRIAVDLNPELPLYSETGVEVHCGPAENLGFLDEHTVDVVFSSNVFEHLSGKTAIARSAREIFRVLRPGGRVIVMGPNINYLPGSYWDYFDHQVPLTEKSMVELLRLCDFTIDRCLPRFLPYTFKSWLPRWPWLVRCYLALGAITFPLFGKQFLIVARKP